MNEIEALAQEYERTVKLPWDQSLAGAQKVWFAIYDPSQERRLRLHVSEFEMATKRAKHDWSLIDITDSFAQWMAQHEYREAYFEQPEDMELALQDYTTYVANYVIGAMQSSNSDENTVVALLGVGSLFGLARASDLMENVTSHIKGRMLVFFPGRREGSNYRLLDARDGWNYLAIPISAADRK